MADAALPPPPPVVITSVWAQCERCDKWRRLPQGAPPVHEDLPWFCEMNPDPTHATCDAPEEAEEPAAVGPPPDLAPFVTLPATRAAATVGAPSRKITAAVGRLLSGGGVWDSGRGRVGASGAAAATYKPPPGWVWDALATSAPPEVVGVAGEAVDAATAAAYFGGGGDGGGPAQRLAAAAVLAAAASAAPACVGGALSDYVPGLVEPLAVGKG